MTSICRWWDLRLQKQQRNQTPGSTTGSRWFSLISASITQHSSGSWCWPGCEPQRCGERKSSKAKHLSCYFWSVILWHDNKYVKQGQKDMQALWTWRSGYIMRCCFKWLEACFVFVVLLTDGHSESFNVCWIHCKSDSLFDLSNHVVFALSCNNTSFSVKEIIELKGALSIFFGVKWCWLQQQLCSSPDLCTASTSFRSLF